MENPLDWKEFERVHMHVGRIIDAQHFPEARKPAYVLTVDFGPELGIKKTSAQLTQRYSLEDLPGKSVVGVMNFPTKQIGPMQSEFLMLGALDEVIGTALLEVASDVKPGTRIA
jgi:tRNA-binding protein